MWKKFVTMMQNVDPKTVARTILGFVALANQIFAICGIDKLPINENDVYQCCSILFTIIMTVVNWWKNNSFTKNAIKADNYLNKLRLQDAVDAENGGEQ